MHTLLTTLAATLMLSAGVASADPLSGYWVLNVGRSHYGGGADPRKDETFDCQAGKETLRCTIRSHRVDGRKLVGTFAAAYDGRPYPATGLPDIDHVMLRKLDEFVADASFTRNGKPVFGYRAIKSDDGRSLTIVSVEPTSRTVLTSVVVYDRR